MNRIIVAFLMLVGIISTGCKSTNIANDSLLVRTGSNLATATALLSVPQADRVSAARETYEIAAAINKAAADQTDLSGVDLIAQQYLDKWNSPYKVIVGSLVKTVEQYVQNYVQNNFANATADEKLKVLREFLLAASAGVEDGSLPYTQGKPVMKLTVSSPLLQKTKGIVLVPYTWEQPK